MEAEINYYQNADHIRNIRTNNKSFGNVAKAN
jgi:hypothetical protein